MNLLVRTIVKYKKTITGSLHVFPSVVLLFLIFLAALPAQLVPAEHGNGSAQVTSYAGE
jgi:hypothetical protein